MGIGNRRRRGVDVEAAVSATTDARNRPLTPWMGAVPRFSPEAPPVDWERRHNTALMATWRRPEQHPVPRRASAHYYAPDAERDPRNSYFY